MKIRAVTREGGFWKAPIADFCRTLVEDFQVHNRSGRSSCEFLRWRRRGHGHFCLSVYQVPGSWQWISGFTSNQVEVQYTNPSQAETSLKFLPLRNHPETSGKKASRGIFARHQPEVPEVATTSNGSPTVCGSTCRGPRERVGKSRLGSAGRSSSLHAVYCGLPLLGS